MVQEAPCPHLVVLPPVLPDTVKLSSNAICLTCSAKDPNLWLCLQMNCGYVGCGESLDDHSLIHSQSTKHPLIMNLSTKRVWCYICESEVVFRPGSLIGNFQNQTTHENTQVPSHHLLHQFSTFHACDSDSESDDKEKKPRGLTGLKNLGNTCYMNAAIQSLSNCPPLTQFFLDCPGYVLAAKKPYLSKIYLKLMNEMWHKRRPNYICPTGLLSGIKQVQPMFRGFAQHDSQEFLRYLMDNLHEELKECNLPSTGYGNESSMSSVVPVRFKVTSSPTLSDLGYDTSDSCTLSNPNSVTVSCSSCSLGVVRQDDNVSNGIQMELEKNMKENISLDATPSSNFIPDNQECGDGSHIPMEGVNRLAIEEGRALGSLSISGESDGKKEVVNSDCGKSLPKLNVSDKGKHSEDGPQTSDSTLVYSSIISDIFDGQISSSVQCMTCETVSTTKENFQDLSLPLPNAEQINFIRSSNNSQVTSASSFQKSVCEEGSAKKAGWISWIFNIFQGVFWGPTIHLRDCLAAFFSADELKGDNMYSCEKCKKLRNGVKFSKVLKLPEMLCVHLKRFRHDNIFSASSSSKIGSFVSFPLERLDMTPYLHKDCNDMVTSYTLAAVICHHGTSSGGHYTAYALNSLNHTWYEFDDQIVSEVDLQQVEGAQAYVLFYQKVDDAMIPLREKAEQIFTSDCNGLMKFYISRKWVSKFNTFAEPGAINNYEFLCKHGAVKPQCSQNVSDLVMELPPVLWEFFHNTFGGGPAVNHLLVCDMCQQELETIKNQQRFELTKFMHLNKVFRENEFGNSSVMAINMAWFRKWENFVRGKIDDPPGKIDNNPICVMRNNSSVLLTNSDHGQMSEECWRFLNNIYGGGPAVVAKQGISSSRQFTPQVFDN